MPSGSAPDSVYLSVWHRPVALSSTSTSPARGPSSSTVSIDSGAPDFHATAARTFMPRILRRVLSRVARAVLVGGSDQEGDSMRWKIPAVAAGLVLVAQGTGAADELTPYELDNYSWYEPTLPS